PFWLTVSISSRPDHDVQKKIENLRTYFGKEYGKECETKPKSGSGAVQAFKSSWPWYESLKWLKDHIGQKESISNLVVNVDATTDSDGSNSSVITPITNKKGKKIKLSAEEKIVQAAEAIAEKFPTLPSEAGNVRVTDDELYGQMIARKLSTLPEGEEKESLKLDIQVLIKNVMFAKASHQIQHHEQPAYQLYNLGGPQYTYQ
ncbi:unnamed protein product, partial [Porites evermanni]